MVECGAADASKAAATWRPGMDSAPEPPDGTFWRYAISPQMGRAGMGRRETKGTRFRAVDVTEGENGGEPRRGIFLWHGRRQRQGGVGLV